MSLIARLIGNDTPVISAHAWPKAFDLWKRDRITLDDLIRGTDLITQSDPVAGVYPAQNKIGIAPFHAYENGQPVYLTATVRVPGGLGYESQGGIEDPKLSLAWFVADANPDVGTIKLADKHGTIIDITDEGEGELWIHAFDDEVVRWDAVRDLVNSDLGNEDTKLRRMMYDEKAEGILCVAQARIEFTSVDEVWEELEHVANWLSKPSITAKKRRG